MNALVDKKKYIASIFFVFVLGAVFQVVVGQLLKDQTLRHHFRLGKLASLTYSFLTTLKGEFHRRRESVAICSQRRILGWCLHLAV
jgi:hypothetical protein